MNAEDYRISKIFIIYELYVAKMGYAYFAEMHTPVV